MRVLSGAGLFTAPGAGDGVHWVEHLRASDLSVGTYSVPAGGDAVPVGPGSVLYVPANEPHHFTDVTSDLAVLVLFAPAEYSRAGH